MTCFFIDAFAIDGVFRVIQARHGAGRAGDARGKRMRAARSAGTRSLIYLKKKNRKISEISGLAVPGFWIGLQKKGLQHSQWVSGRPLRSTLTGTGTCGSPSTPPTSTASSYSERNYIVSFSKWFKNRCSRSNSHWHDDVCAGNLQYLCKAVDF